MPTTIRRCYTRLYSDSGQLKAYVEWRDGARTEGAAVLYHGKRVPTSPHMCALFEEAVRHGLQVEHETW